MTTPPSPPNRRRRRVVVTLAAIAVGLCWWLWPRVDQRFVGKWQCQGLVMHFRRDGIVDNFVQFDGGRLLLTMRTPARYKAVGNRLQIMPDQATGWRSVVNDVRRLFRWKTPELIYDGEVVNFTSEAMTLQGSGPHWRQTTYEIRRIPE